MIHYIRGTLAEKTEGGVIVETGGIGYDIAVPANSALYLEDEGSMITVYTYMKVSEDGVSLSGFSDEVSLELFKRLISVNGVGAKAALSLLSAAPVGNLIRAIILGDTAVLKSASGVGKKSAERVILELKDKLGDLSARVSGSPEEEKGILAAAAGASGTLEKGPRGEAVEALIALGYSKTEATVAVSAVPSDELDVSGYVRAALARI